MVHSSLFIFVFLIFLLSSPAAAAANLPLQCGVHDETTTPLIDPQSSYEIFASSSRCAQLTIRGGNFVGLFIQQNIVIDKINIEDSIIGAIVLRVAPAPRSSRRSIVIRNVTMNLKLHTPGPHDLSHGTLHIFGASEEDQVGVNIDDPSTYRFSVDVTIAQNNITGYSVHKTDAGAVFCSGVSESTVTVTQNVIHSAAAILLMNQFNLSTVDIVGNTFVHEGAMPTSSSRFIGVLNAMRPQGDIRIKSNNVSLTFLGGNTNDAIVVKGVSELAATKVEVSHNRIFGRRSAVDVDQDYGSGAVHVLNVFGGDGPVDFENAGAPRRLGQILLSGNVVELTGYRSMSLLRVSAVFEAARIELSGNRARGVASAKLASGGCGIKLGNGDDYHIKFIDMILVANNDINLVVVRREATSPPDVTAEQLRRLLENGQHGLKKEFDFGAFFGSIAALVSADSHWSGIKQLRIEGNKARAHLDLQKPHSFSIIGIVWNVGSIFLNFDEFVVAGNDVTLTVSGGNGVQGAGFFSLPCLGGVVERLVMKQNRATVDVQLAPTAVLHDPAFVALKDFWPSLAHWPALTFASLRIPAKSISIATNELHATSTSFSLYFFTLAMTAPLALTNEMGQLHVTRNVFEIQPPKKQQEKRMRGLSVSLVVLGPYTVPDSQFRSLAIENNAVSCVTHQFALVSFQETRSPQLTVQLKGNKVLVEPSAAHVSPGLVVAGVRLLENPFSTKSFKSFDTRAVPGPGILDDDDEPRLPGRIELFALSRSTDKSNISIISESNSLSISSASSSSSPPSICSLFTVALNRFSEPFSFVEMNTEKTRGTVSLLSVDDSLLAEGDEADGVVCGAGAVLLNSEDNRLGRASITGARLTFEAKQPPKNFDAAAAVGRAALVAIGLPSAVELSLRGNTLRCVAAAAAAAAGGDNAAPDHDNKLHCSTLLVGVGVKAKSHGGVLTRSRPFDGNRLAAPAVPSPDVRIVLAANTIFVLGGGAVAFEPVTLQATPRAAKKLLLDGQFGLASALLDARAYQGVCNLLRVGGGGSLETKLLTARYFQPLVDLSDGKLFVQACSDSLQSLTASLETRTLSAEPPFTHPYMKPLTSKVNDGMQGANMAFAAVASSVVPTLGFAVARQQAMVGLVERAKTGDCSGLGDPEAGAAVADSPTQMQIGSSDGRWYVGAAVGNTVLIVSLVLAAQLGGTFYLHKTKSSSWNKPFEVFARCYVSMALFVCLSILLAPTLTLALVVVAAGTVPVAERVLAVIFSVAVAAVTVYYTVWALVLRERKEKYKKPPEHEIRKKEAEQGCVQRMLSYWFEGEGEWTMPKVGGKVTRKDHLDFDAANPQIDGYNNRAPWFAFADFGIMVALALAALIVQFVPASKSCVTHAVLQAVILSAYAFLCCWKRPFQELFLRLATPIVTLVQIVVVVIVAAMTDLPAWIDTVVIFIVSLQSFIAVFTVLAALQPLSKHLVRAWRRFKQRISSKPKQQRPKTWTVQDLLRDDGDQDDDGDVELVERRGGGGGGRNSGSAGHKSSRDQRHRHHDHHHQRSSGGGGGGGNRSNSPTRERSAEPRHRDHRPSSSTAGAPAARSSSSRQDYRQDRVSSGNTGNRQQQSRRSGGSGSARYDQDSRTHHSPRAGGAPAAVASSSPRNQGGRTFSRPRSGRNFEEI